MHAVLTPTGGLLLSETKEEWIGGIEGRLDEGTGEEEGVATVVGK